MITLCDAAKSHITDHHLMIACLLLFASAFAAATILPLQSEALLLALLSQGYMPLLLLVVASTGNILGACVNWYLGRKLNHFQHKKWFPATPKQLQRAERFYGRYGFYSLLLSWVPIIGDPLTLVAGLLKEPFWRFVLMVSIAKVGRYVALYGLWLGWV